MIIEKKSTLKQKQGVFMKHHTPAKRTIFKIARLILGVKAES